MKDNWFAREMICDQNRALGFTEVGLERRYGKKEKIYAEEYADRTA